MFITFGCLVSAVQVTINYKSRLRGKLTKLWFFPNLHTVSIGLCVCSYVSRGRRNMKSTNSTCTLSMSNPIKWTRLNHWTEDEKNPSKLR